MAISGISSDIIITQGFIGSYNGGVVRKTTTLGRGGSDYSASLIGGAIGADVIEIWTDVDGVLSADPRVCSGAIVISNLSFSAVKSLSYWGAKVIHPKTIFPAISKDIPIKINNTFNRASIGTSITSAGSPGAGFKMSAVIGKSGCY